MNICCCIRKASAQRGSYNPKWDRVMRRDDFFSNLFQKFVVLFEIINIY